MFQRILGDIFKLTIQICYVRGYYDCQNPMFFKHKLGLQNTYADIFGELDLPE